jgi:5-methylthioadenosine/S-adenosylhomocysteine deaminase
LDITTHLSQSWNEVAQVRKMYGKTPPQHLNDIGLLDERLSAAHCTYVTDRDTELLRKSGMKVLHCPRPYALNGVTSPLVSWLDMGIPVGLGTDNLFHSMCETMRVGLYTARLRADMLGGAHRKMASENLSFLKILELATIKGAEVMGIDGKVGSIEPGKKADIITFKTSPHMRPTMEPVSGIVLYGGSGDIDDVIIDGGILKDKGVLQGLDIHKVLDKAQDKTEGIWERFFEDSPHLRDFWRRYTP